MDDGFSAGFDHHLCKCRPGTDTFATALRCLSKRLLAWAKWAGDVAGPISIVGIVLGHHVALADEAGVSVWLPGTFEVSRLFRFSRDSIGRRRIITQQPRTKAARNLKRVGALSEASGQDPT